MDCLADSSRFMDIILWQMIWQIKLTLMMQAAPFNRWNTSPSKLKTPESDIFQFLLIFKL